jgi:4-hydroxythreonine-4-phosphate dehydrogenase
MDKPIIGLTMGDPAGVGPELCLRALGNPELAQAAQLLILGDAGVLRACAEKTALPGPPAVLTLADWQRDPTLNGPAVLDLPFFDSEGFTPGVVSARTGAAAFHYVEASICEALAGRIQAVTTAPLNKEALQAAGIKFPGHTEIFAERTRAARSCMFQYSTEVRASFVTVHVGYHEVPMLLTVERILDVIELTHHALSRIQGRRPKLAILGLNPHAGEHGLFGNQEEERIIIPAMIAAQSKGIDIEGPLPPDTAFIPAKRRSTDGFICMYHDQGHIPLKALAFDSAVNTTLGLPIVRTSVDHGTACDIAWQGIADCGSMTQAVLLAAKLYQNS